MKFKAGPGWMRLLFTIYAVASVHGRVQVRTSGGAQVCSALDAAPSGLYEHAAVSTEHPTCSAIGKAILLKGGNAVDSAIASLLCIGVVNSFSAGIGG